MQREEIPFGFPSRDPETADRNRLSETALNSDDKEDQQVHPESHIPKKDITKLHRQKREQMKGPLVKYSNGHHSVDRVYKDHSHDLEDATQFNIYGILQESSPITDNSNRYDNVKTQRSRGGVAIPFPLKLHSMLKNAEKELISGIVSWLPHGRAFLVHKPREFVSKVLPRNFKQSKLTSFQRQLNLYGYRRLTAKGPDYGAYYHEMFLRGRAFLCHKMIRTKIKGMGFKTASSPESEPCFYAMEFVYNTNATVRPSAPSKSFSSPQDPTLKKTVEKVGAISRQDPIPKNTIEKGAVISRTSSKQKSVCTKNAPPQLTSGMVTPDKRPRNALKDGALSPFWGFDEDFSALYRSPCEPKNVVLDTASSSETPCSQDDRTAVPLSAHLPLIIAVTPNSSSQDYWQDRGFFLPSDDYEDDPPLRHSLYDLKNVASRTGNADEAHYSRCDRDIITFEGMQFHYLDSLDVETLIKDSVNQTDNSNSPQNPRRRRSMMILDDLDGLLLPELDSNEKPCHCSFLANSEYEELMPPEPH